MTTDYSKTRDLVLSESKKFFKPEFLNRLDDLIVFHHLTPEELRQIVDLMINNLNNRLEEKNLSIEVSNKAKDRLAKDGFSEIYGARPLKRLIEDQIENTISLKIISGELALGTKIVVDFVRGKYTFKEST